MTPDNAPYDYLDPAPTGVCPICDGRRWIYYNGGRMRCDGCGGDGRNHYDHESNTPEEAGRLERDRDPIQPRWVNGMPRDPDEIPSKDEL